MRFWRAQDKHLHTGFLTSSFQAWRKEASRSRSRRWRPSGQSLSALERSEAPARSVCTCIAQEAIFPDCFLEALLFKFPRLIQSLPTFTAKGTAEQKVVRECAMWVPGRVGFPGKRKDRGSGGSEPGAFRQA